MKIINFTDVITNSSSEIYAIYHKEGLEEIKNIVNEILKVGESKYTFDDLFTIKFLVDTESDILELWENDYPYDKNPTEEQLVEYALNMIDNDPYSNCNYIYGFEVTAKDPKDFKAAQAIDYIDNIFGRIEKY